MSLPTNQFINGIEPSESPSQTAARELREAEIFNFQQEELTTGASVFTFDGALLPLTVGIMNRNGFRAR